jgi:hypothetical protein
MNFSYFCWAAPSTTLKSSTVIKIMNAWFRGVGFPQYVYSDNGPQFDAAEFKDYYAANIRVRVLFDSPILWIDMYIPSADAWHRRRRELCH